MNQTIDDLSSVADSEPPVPGFVMVATGRQAQALACSVPAELGRRIAADGDVHEVEDERMSRDHATVRFERGSWVITDRDSRNGTFVDGEKITGEVRRRGDIVMRLGHTVFVLLTDWRAPGRRGRRARGRARGTQLYRLLEKYGLARDET